MKILVPLDGSETAEAAVPIAMRLASESKAALMLLSVVSLRVPQDPSPADVNVVRISDAKAYLETAKSHLMSACADAVTTVWCGTPAAAIIGAAQAYGADLIVMTSHGRRDLQREMFGSVAEAVLREAPMQVIVVRPRRAATGVPTESARAATTTSA